MRLVVMGAGGVGGVLGAKLALAGHDVVLVARGSHHDAIAAHGLRHLFRIPARLRAQRRDLSAAPHPDVAQAGP